MSSQPTSNNMSKFLQQWVTRFENHKKKIAAEEKITAMKLGAKTAYYIQHAEESSLRSTDQRRQTLNQYKYFTSLIEHLSKTQGSTDEIQHLLDRFKMTFEAEHSTKSSNHSSMNKLKQLIADFQTELAGFLIEQKKSAPKDEIKR